MEQDSRGLYLRRRVVEHCADLGRRGEQHGGVGEEGGAEDGHGHAKGRGVRQIRERRAVCQPGRRVFLTVFFELFLQLFCLDF